MKQRKDMTQGTAFIISKLLTFQWSSVKLVLICWVLWVLFGLLRFLFSSQQYATHLSCWIKSSISLSMKFKLRFCLWECKWIRSNNRVCISSTRAVYPTAGFFSNCRISTGCGMLLLYWQSGSQDFQTLQILSVKTGAPEIPGRVFGQEKTFLITLEWEEPENSRLLSIFKHIQGRLGALGT